MKTTLLTLVLAALILTPAFCQEETTPTKKSQRNSRVNIDESAIKLEFVAITNIRRLREINRVLQQLHGRSIRVMSEDGSYRYAHNLQSFGNSIILYDEANMVAKMKSPLARLDVAEQTTHRFKRSLAVKEYKVRFITIGDAESALRSFRRRIDVSTSASQQSEQNITLVYNRGIVVMRDTNDHIEKMLAVLQRIDQPKAQFMISCQLIQGAQDEVGDRLDKLIPNELRQMSPYKHFRSVASGVIRVSAGGRQPISLSMNGADGVTARLSFQPTSYDAEGGSLALDNIVLKFTKAIANSPPSGQSFSTSTSIKNNDYVVIGAFGDNPVFAVLQLIPLK